jgi:hypothetical protein
LSAARKQKESISTIPGNQFQGLKQHIYGNKEQDNKNLRQEPGIGRRKPGSGESYGPRIRKYVPE